ncbi:MAG: extracellular solute-binding protein [Firmicutes bacterium]|nr:extracellular solute-binding protein [Bacillota bacterium]
MKGYGKVSVGLVAATSLIMGTVGTVSAHPRLIDGHKPVTVTLMTWQSAHTNQLILNAMKPLEKKYPWIHVKNIPTPSSDYYQKLDTMFTAHNLPDLFWSGNEHEQDWGAQKLLYNWTKYAKNPGVPWFSLKKFAPDAVVNWRVNGQLYGLPTMMNTYGYYYNANLFKAAHLPLPKVGWTYAQFYHDAQVLTQKSGSKVTRYGVITPNNDVWYMGQYAESAGGVPFENRIADPTKITAAKQLIDGTELMVKAIKNGSVAPPTYTVSNSTAVFATGTVPMMGGGQWLTTSILQDSPKFQWGWAPQPIVKRNVQPYDAVGIASPSNIADPSAVWLVLSYLDTDGLGTMLGEHPVASPAYVPAASSYFNTLKKDGEASVGQSVKYELTAPLKNPGKFLSTWASNADNVITAEWNDILMDKVPTYKGVNHMVYEINQAIKTAPPS